MLSPDNLQLALRLLPTELLNSLYMIFVSGFLAALIGFPIGCLLHLTQNRWLYRGLGLVVNIFRSIPFAILMIALIPFTRLIVGTSLGTTASIVPLTIAAAPFFARLVESAFGGVDRTYLDAARVMGASTGQIVRKVLLPESLPALLSGFTLTLVTLVGYTTMVGLVGGGGLGKVAIQYGYQRFNGFLMLTTLVLLLLLVEIIQWLGNSLVRALKRKRGLV